MKLALMGDLHYHDVDDAAHGWREARDAFYGGLLDEFFRIDADFHVSLGDLTNFGTATELEGVYGLIRRHDRHFVHVLGNHDLYAQPRASLLAFTGGERYRAIETDEAVLAFLDTAREMDRDVWGGHVDDEQLAWLESVVRASAAKPLLVFAHHPVHRTTKRSELDNGSIDPAVDIRRALALKKGTGVYFNGHTHVDSIVREDNWTFVQLSACLDQQSFRVVEVDEDGIRVSAVDLNDEALAAHARKCHAHMPYFRHTPEARGMHEERVCAVLTANAGRG